MGRRRGSGPSRSTALSTFAATTDRTPRWYRAAARQKAGRILAAGLTKEVTFEPVEGSALDSIDEAYRAKYRGNRYLEPMIGARARSATLRIMPIDGSRS